MGERRAVVAVSAWIGALRVGGHQRKAQRRGALRPRVARGGVGELEVPRDPRGIGGLRSVELVRAPDRLDVRWVWARSGVVAPPAGTGGAAAGEVRVCRAARAQRELAGH